jgi:hypothetical protein
MTRNVDALLPLFHFVLRAFEEYRAQRRNDNHSIKKKKKKKKEKNHNIFYVNDIFSFGKGVRSFISTREEYATNNILFTLNAFHLFFFRV